MPNDTAPEEEKFAKLESAVRKGWAKRHPLTSQQRNFFRAELKKQLTEDKDLSQEERRKKAEKRQKELMQEQQFKQNQDRGRSR